MKFQINGHNLRRLGIHLLVLGGGAAVAAIGQDLVTHTNNPPAVLAIGTGLSYLASFLRSVDQ